MIYSRYRTVRRIQNLGMGLYNWWTSRLTRSTGALVSRDSRKHLYLIEMGVESTLLRHCQISVEFTPAEMHGLYRELGDMLAGDTGRAGWEPR